MARASWATVLVLLAAATLLAAPWAAASTVGISFSDDFGQAPLHAEGELRGSEADAVRYYMDNTGNANRDGTVSEEEATRFVLNAKHLIGSFVAAMLTGENLTLDGGEADSEIGNVAFQGAAGPVRGGDPITFQLDMTFLFQAQAGLSHELRIVGRATPGGTLSATITLPAGWSVTSVDGLPDATTGTGIGSVQFDMPTDGTALTFHFTKTHTSPAFGAIAALGATAIALAVAHSRRGRREPDA